MSGEQHVEDRELLEAQIEQAEKTLAEKRERRAESASALRAADDAVEAADRRVNAYEAALAVLNKTAHYSRPSKG